MLQLPQEYLHDADLAAEWMEHNNVLSQALDNFNSTHPGAALYTFDFGDILTEVELFTHVISAEEALLH